MGKRNMAMARNEVLLRACYDMLKLQREAGYVISPFENTVHYDDADCDGFCLMMDIEDALGLAPRSSCPMAGSRSSAPAAAGAAARSAPPRAPSNATGSWAAGRRAIGTFARPMRSRSPRP